MPKRINERDAGNFIRMIARFAKDGEVQTDGTTFDMMSDDAVETLNSLITRARELAGFAPKPTMPPYEVRKALRAATLAIGRTK